MFDNIDRLVLSFTSFGSCVVQFGCYTMTDLDTKGGSMSLCL